ncbi:MAG TPA: hypothetical protein VLT57_09065 [Bryobacteraceae bacterium]|jgi:hypothetical protein|nr:hypothetical protein [Bryobacteraceae bacterium]
MATLATIFDKFTWTRTVERSLPQTAAVADDSTLLRAIPNDDIYFFVKRIDNSQVVREADPAASRACWKAFGTAVAGAALVVGLLAPSLYGLLSGYQLENLRQEQQHLKVEQAALDLQEARLMSPARLAELANAQQLVNPGPQRLVYLDGKDKKLAQR